MRRIGHKSKWKQKHFMLGYDEKMLVKGDSKFVVNCIPGNIVLHNFNQTLPSTSSEVKLRRE